MKQMEVTIMGQSYLLGCPEGGEAALSKAVSQVDKEMCAIRDSGKIKARERIAVLAALNLAFSLSDATAQSQTQAPSSSPSSSPSAAPESLPEIDVLMKRIDEALAQDGQLL